VHKISLRVQTVHGDWIPMDFNAIPDMDTQAINRVHLLEGTWPPEDKEVAVEQSKLSEIGVGWGIGSPWNCLLARRAACTSWHR